MRVFIVTWLISSTWYQFGYAVGKSERIPDVGDIQYIVNRLFKFVLNGRSFKYDNSCVVIKNILRGKINNTKDNVAHRESKQAI